MGLYHAYNKVPMPNLRMSHEEVMYVLDFLKAETRRIGKIERVEAIAERHNEEAPECCKKDEEAVLTDEEAVLEAVAEAPENESETAGVGSESREQPAPQKSRHWLQTASMLLGTLLGLGALLMGRKKS